MLRSLTYEQRALSVGRDCSEQASLKAEVIIPSYQKKMLATLKVFQFKFVLLIFQKFNLVVFFNKRFFLVRHIRFRKAKILKMLSLKILK